MALTKSNKYQNVYFNSLKNNDRTYYVSYRDENGKLTQLKIGKKSEGITEKFAYDKRSEIIHNLKFEEELPKFAQKKVKITLNELADIYLEAKKRTKNYIRMKQKYDKTIRPKFGTKSAENISMEDMNKLVDDLLNEDKANKTVKDYIHLIKTIYNYAIKFGKYTGKIPQVELSDLKIDNERERYLKTKEIHKLRLFTYKSDYCYISIILSLNLGARIESILNIRVKDIDYDSNNIKLKDFKSEETYYGYMNEELLEILTKYISKHNLTDNQYLVGKRETRFSYNTLYNNLQPVLNLLFNNNNEDRKEKVVLHSFRHTFASHLAINDVPIYHIQKLLNHSKIDMTLRYAKLSTKNYISSVNKIYKD